MDKKRILVVEDEAVTAKDVQAQLIALGFEVPVAALTGEEAVRAAREARPDLILMDITLRGRMNGIEAAEAIRASDKIPVVFLTAHEDGDTVARAKISEPYGYITKPYSISTLLSTIETALYKSELDARLRASEERLRFHQDNSPMAVIEWSEDFIVTRWTGAAEETFGWSKEETVGKPVLELGLVHEENAPLMRSVMRRMADGALKRDVIANRCYTKKGRLLHCEWYLSALRDAGGRMTSVLSQVLDVTERVFTEQIVRAQRNELAAIYENAPFIMLLVDRDRRVRKVNKRGAAFADSTAANMIEARSGDALRCIHSLDDPKGCGFSPHCEGCVMRRTVMNTLDTGTAHSLVESAMRFATDQGVREAAVLLSATRLTIGREELALVTILDVTERKRLELETRHAQTKLIHANKMSSLGMLVSSVAHEVNNPNNFIMFNSSLLSGAWNDIVRALDDRAREDGGFQIAGLPYAEMREAVPKLLAGITDGSRRIKDMVDRLRELSREDRSGLRGTIEVNAAVRNAVMILQNEIMKHTDRFSLSLADQVPPVTGSPQQIEQVVINLVQNALQALGDRGRAVSVRTFVDGERRKVVIEVADGGCGISPDNLRRITEPFFTTKLDSGGTGLGLSISSAILRDHGGSIDFQSEENMGTVVRINLPHS